MSRTLCPAKVEIILIIRILPRKDYKLYVLMIALIRICRWNVLLCYAQGAWMACKNGIIFPGNCEKTRSDQFMACLIVSP